MPHISGWRCFLTLCLSTKEEKLLSGVFDALLTPEEKSNIALRCLIFKELLAENKTQREIAENLQVSIAKITRGSNELKRIPAKVTDYLRNRLAS